MNHGSFQNLKILSAEKTLHFTKSLDMKDHADSLEAMRKFPDGFPMDHGPSGPSGAELCQVSQI